MKNPFDFIEEHWREIVGLGGMLIIGVSMIYLSSIPEKGNVFEGTITRMELDHMVVYVRNNQTIGSFNSTVGMCYDDPYKYVCRIGDRVELTQYTSWFDEIWAITALVD